MFDLSDLTLPTPSTRRGHDWLCLHCRRVSISHASCKFCNSSEFIPHLDRRPLLLSKEARNGIIDLIDQAATKMVDLEIEEQLHYTGEYMPFLSRLLDDAELAETRLVTLGSGFRSTDLSIPELLALFKEMRFPPTSGG